MCGQPRSVRSRGGPFSEDIGINRKPLIQGVVVIPGIFVMDRGFHADADSEGRFRKPGTNATTVTGCEIAIMKTSRGTAAK